MNQRSRPFSLQQITSLLAGLTGDYVLLETAKISGQNFKSFLFHNPVDRIQCVGKISPTEFLDRCQTFLERGFYLAGWFSYEFGFGLEPKLNHLLPGNDTVLADLGVFSEPLIFNHKSGEWNSEDIPAGKTDNTSCTVENIRLSENQTDYEKNIAKIKSYITAGDTYQVNYTLKLLFDLQGAADALYLQLRRNQSVSYSAYIKNGEQRIMSFSPELFFSKDNTTCTVRPMKGTSPRGRNIAEDEDFADHLQNDLKNRAENVMIVDLLRNDLGRLAEMGSVEVESLFDIETYESLLQMTSTISAKTVPDLSLENVFKALFPCGSVTGAPKIRTMEIIHELETLPRGVYTGAIGYLAPNGDAVFNVPIRTVALNGSAGEMGIGSGIVFDSKAEKEWQECQLKANFLSKPRQDFQLIETLLWVPDKGYWLVDYHLKRLQASARYFGYIFDKDQIANALKKNREKYNNKPARVRLLLDEMGKLTLTHTECPHPQNISLPLDTRPEASAKVCLAAKSINSSDIFLYHKSTNRQFYDQNWQEANKKGFFDLLFTNERDEISEGAITNIFLESNGIFYTPPVKSGLLPGVFREHLLATYPDQVKEKILHLKDLQNPANTLYVGNSVRGLVRVELVCDA